MLKNFKVLSLCAFVFSPLLFAGGGKKPVDGILPFIDLAQTQKHLGFRNEKDFDKNVKHLTRMLLRGVYLEKERESCHKSYTGTLCSLLADYFDYHNKKPYRRKRPKLKYAYKLKNISKLQSANLEALFRTKIRLKSKVEARFVKAALKHNSCPRNFSMKLVDHLDRKKIDRPLFKTLEKLENHALACDMPKDNRVERLFLESALRHFSFGQSEAALKRLEIALSAYKPDERYRLLYWKVKVLRKLGKKSESTLAFKKLVSEYPMSWHVLQLSSYFNHKPFAFILKNKVFDDQYRAGNKVVDDAFLWLNAASNYSLTAQKIVPKLSDFIIKQLKGHENPGFFQHFSRFLNKHQLLRLQIITMNKLRDHQLAKLNKRNIKLLYPIKFQGEVLKQSSGVNPLIILSLIRQESAFNQFAYSPAKARGLMQLLHPTARSMRKRVKKHELYDPSINIKLGSLYLKRLTKVLGSLEKALLAYNGGIGRVRKWEKRFAFAQDINFFTDLIPFDETRDYKDSILRNAYWYYLLYPEHFSSFSTINKMESQWLKELVVDSRGSFQHAIQRKAASTNQ